MRLAVGRVTALCALAFSVSAAPTQAQGWYGNNWQYRKAINIDGTQIAGNLSAFPVLISLTDSDLSARALANGFDILFTDTDGITKLDHERTRWVSGTGELIAWVKVTSLTAGVDKTIYMYYGNVGAADQQSVAAVWSNGYEAVYHLDDDFADATGNHAPGTNFNSVDIPGLIGDGQDFEQANNTDHIDVGNWSVAGSQLTIQSWVRYESFAINDARIVSKAVDAMEQEHVFMLSNINVGSPTNWRMRLKTGTQDASGTTTLIQPTNTVSPNTWYLTAATYDGATMRLLQNGGQVASVGKTGNLRQNGWSIYLGNNPRDGTTTWYKALDGILDEVRISSAARSSSWLTTEYNNQRPGSTFYLVGPEEPLTSVEVLPDTTRQDHLPSNGTDYTVNFTVSNTGGGTDSYDLLTSTAGGGVINVVSISGPSVTQGTDPDSARLANLAAGDASIVTVTYSVAPGAAGTIDTLLFMARSVSSPAQNDEGQLILTLIMPDLVTAKSVDPNGSQLPGTQLTYTVTITNTGSEAANSVVVLDSLPAEIDFKVSSVLNNLPGGISVTVEYSNDGGAGWAYTPVSQGCGAPIDYDGCVTHVRWTLQNPLGSTAPDNTGTLEFVARIK